MSLKSAFSLAVIKAINNSTLFLVAATNCSLKSIRCWRFRDPFKRPLPRYSCLLGHVDRSSSLGHLLGYLLGHFLKYPLEYLLRYFLKYSLGYYLVYLLKHLIKA